MAAARSATTLRGKNARCAFLLHAKEYQLFIELVKLHFDMEEVEDGAMA